MVAPANCAEGSQVPDTKHVPNPRAGDWQAWAQQTFPRMRRLIVSEQLITVRPPKPFDIKTSWLGRSRHNKWCPPSSLLDIRRDEWDGGIDEHGSPGSLLGKWFEGPV